MPQLETSRGLTWHYDCEGEGPPLLFLHGWGVNRRIWRQQSKYFSRRHRTVSVDLPGHGQTSWQPVSLRDIAEDIGFLLKRLRLDRVGVVASSFGGLVALKLFELFPDRIGFFVFAGSQPKFSRSDDYPFGLEAARIRKLASQVRTHYPGMVNIFFRSLFTQQERESRRFRWIQTFRKTDDVPRQEALLEILNILETEDLRPVLEKVDRPIQFITGTDDYICTKDCLIFLQNNVRHARLDWFEHCGHFPFLSRPHEFNQVMEEFILDHQPPATNNQPL